MTLMRLIYASHPFGFDDLALSGILTTAQRNNLRDGITGALICREDLYMQLLEGARASVEAAFDRIRRDDRHTDIVVLVQEMTTQRMFPTWSMRHDPAKSWMWTRDQVREGRVEDATREEVMAMFVRLLAEQPGPLSGQPRAVCPMSRQTEAS